MDYLIYDYNKRSYKQTTLILGHVLDVRSNLFMNFRFRFTNYFHKYRASHDYMYYLSSTMLLDKLRSYFQKVVGKGSMQVNQFS